MSRSGPPALRRLVVPALFVAALFLVTFLRRPPETPAAPELEISGPTMGTVFNVKVVTDDTSEAQRNRLTGLMRSAVDAVDHTMSTYRSDSEIETFNGSGTDPFPASPEFLAVVAEAQRISELTGGAFDITVGPLVNLWGFGPAGVTGAPAEEELQRLVDATGYRLLEVDVAAGTLRKTRAEIRIDLSAIAKGFAADQMSAALTAEGLTNHMVEIGGEVRTSGRNAAGRPWRIGVERPSAVGRSLHSAIELQDRSMATSGDYRNYVERDGVRLSHMIDPRTGRPITHHLASVSVVHSSCMTADALATALEVLGPDAGIRLAEEEGVAALFQIRVGKNEFTEKQTSAWAELVANSSPAPAVE